MKKIRTITIVAFIAIIVIPIINMNTKSDVISEIDNRKLAESPIKIWRESKETGEDFDFDDSMTSYVSDRIGFRNEMIYAYINMYDKIFHEMKHPVYTYGRDGYVFFNMSENINYYDFHDEYINMMKKINDYCKARDIPCYFLFEPSKTTIYTQYLPKGVYYNREWADKMLNKMRADGIQVVDNTVVLKEKASEGEQVFNKKYNAGHWNDLGAYYGVNNLITALKKDGIAVQENQKTDFDVKNEERNSLQVSEFPIYDTEPVFYARNKVTDLTSEYDKELERDNNYRAFLHTKNNNISKTPKVMVLQGSYMNNMEYKFMSNAFSEYIAVHDYQNTMNFDYYYNIFKPDVVVIEVAEYACSPNYFDQTTMKNMRLNPPLDLGIIKENINLSKSDLKIKRGEKLTKITIPSKVVKNLEQNYSVNKNDYVYLLVDDEVFDFKAKERGDFADTCTVANKIIDGNSKVVLVISNGKKAIKVNCSD